LSGQGFILPNASALSLAPFSTLAGTASALLGALQLGIGALASALVSILHNHTAIPMTGIMMICVVLSMATLLLGQKQLLRNPLRSDGERELTPDVGIT
ncbi:MAG: Bcr/CflA family drug resistance efflux transporter, partial [Ferruginibacter sp.]|nr:Bcr/CflA family drug resistance efflux transporter [Chitinophagaceae bacterium]